MLTGDTNSSSYNLTHLYPLFATIKGQEDVYSSCCDFWNSLALMAAVAFICMLVPVFCIREKDYVDTVPAKESAFGSLTATFKNGEFRKFVASDIFYWIALTMFQTGLPFFVTSLLKLPETMTTLYFVGMTALSLVFYIPVNSLLLNLEKKKDDFVRICSI